MELIAKLANLAWLDISGANVDDRGAEILARMPALKGVQAYATKMTEKGAMALRSRGITVVYKQ